MSAGDGATRARYICPACFRHTTSTAGVVDQHTQYLSLPRVIVCDTSGTEVASPE